MLQKYEILYDKPIIINVPAVFTINRLNDKSTSMIKWHVATMPCKIESTAQRTVYRIRRCADGVLGGLVESPINLSQDGACWIAPNAVVYGSGKVRENAVVGNLELDGFRTNYVWSHDAKQMPEDLGAVTGQICIGDAVYICGDANISVSDSALKFHENNYVETHDISNNMCGYIGSTDASVLCSNYTDTMIRIKNNATIVFDDEITNKRFEQGSLDASSYNIRQQRTRRIPNLIIAGKIMDHSDRSDLVPIEKVYAMPRVEIGSNVFMRGSTVLCLSQILPELWRRMDDLEPTSMRNLIEYEDVTAHETSFIHANIVPVSAYPGVMGAEMTAPTHTMRVVYKNVKTENSSMGMVSDVWTLVDKRDVDKRDTTTMVSGSTHDTPVMITNSFVSVRPPCVLCGDIHIENCMLEDIRSPKATSTLELKSSQVGNAQLIGNIRIIESTVETANNTQIRLSGRIYMNKSYICSFGVSDGSIIGKWSINHSSIENIEMLASKNGVFTTAKCDRVNVAMNKRTWVVGVNEAPSTIMDIVCEAPRCCILKQHELHVADIGAVWTRSSEMKMFQKHGRIKKQYDAYVPVRRNPDGTVVVADVYEMKININKEIVTNIHKTNIEQIQSFFHRVIHAYSYLDRHTLPKDHGVAIARWKRKDVVSFLQAGDVSRIDVTACVPYKILWSGKDDV